MIDLESDDYQPGRERLDWLKDVKRANFKTDCADYRQYRLFGNAFRYGDHRVEWHSNKKNKDTVFSHLCPKLNPDTCKYDRVFPEGHPKAGKLVDCPYCDDMSKKPSDRYLIHAIDRTLQAAGQNPVVALRLPESVMITIWNKRQFNKVDGKPYSLAHADYGYDIYLKFNPTASPQQMYSLETGNAQHTPLTPTERSYPTYDFARLYREVGVRQADPADFRTFLDRVGILKMAASGGGTQMPSGGFGGSDDDLPASYGGPSFGAGNSFGGGGGTQMPSGSGFTPPVVAAPAFVPPTAAATESGPSSRFSGQPTADQQKPVDALAMNLAGSGGPVRPACFKDDKVQGTMGCVKCPVKRECLAD